MGFEIIRADITKLKCNAIVNSVNPHSTYMNGIDSAIYEADEKCVCGDMIDGNVILKLSMTANVIK